MFKEPQKIKIVLQLSNAIEEHIEIEDEYDFVQKIKHLQQVYNLQSMPMARIIKQVIFSVQNFDQKNELTQKILKCHFRKNKQKHIRKQSLQIENLKPRINTKKSVKQLSFSNLNNSLTSCYQKPNQHTQEINLYQKNKQALESFQKKSQSKIVFKRPKIRTALQSCLYSSIKQRKIFPQANKENVRDLNQEKRNKEKKDLLFTKKMCQIYELLDQQKLGFINFKNLDLNGLNSEQLNLAQKHILKMSFNSSKNFSLRDFLQLCNRN